MRFISTFAASFERTKNLYQGYTKGIQKAGIACFSLEASIGGMYSASMNKYFRKQKYGTSCLQK